MAFVVTNIIDGNTIEVQGWKWVDYKGRIVKIAGYNVSSQYDSFAKKKLITLLEGKEIELKKVIKAEKRDGDNNDVIYCSVYLNDVDIAQYFPELAQA